MALARKRQICLSNTKYYHCVSRCVRRAYLCGEDTLTGKSYEHRRGWVEDRLLVLAKVFCIDVCAYAVMSNHTHIVLYVDDKKANRLTDKAVLLRWNKLSKMTPLGQNFLRGEQLSDVQQAFLNKEVAEYRTRLSSISWFMRMLNEYIARRANKEDECTGHFWEGRFKSQALLDESALLACMAYVDLNPVRAEVARTPEQSDYTSFKKRCQEAKNSKQPKLLARFVGGMNKNKSKGIPFELKSYLLLVEQTGRCISTDKRGYIDHHLPPILERLNLEPANWLTLTTQFEHLFHGAVGRIQAIENYCSKTARKRRSNRTNSLLLLAS